MILRSQLITLNQVIIGIGKTTNSLIVRVVCNVGLTVRARRAVCLSVLRRAAAVCLVDRLCIMHACPCPTAPRPPAAKLRL